MKKSQRKIHRRMDSSCVMLRLTWDGDKTVTVYYDGQPDGTGFFDYEAHGPINPLRADPLEIQGVS